MSKYYSILLFIENFSKKINNSQVLNIADGICKYLNCDYDYLGYSLLHPDYDYKDIGVSMKKTYNKHEFLTLNIPNHFYGKESIPSAPYVFFEVSEKNNSSFPDFVISFRYPVFDNEAVEIEIVANSKLVSFISLNQFSDIISLVNSNEYVVNSALLHYYRGSNKRLILSGGQMGLCSIEENRTIKKSVMHRANYKDKLLDIFLFNSINKKCLPIELIKKAIEIVGSENVVDKDSMFTFSLSQSLSKYLLNNYFPTLDKRKLRKIFKDML